MMRQLGTAPSGPARSLGRWRFLVHLACRGAPREILDEGRTLFWDADPAGIEEEAHASWVIARVLSHGTWRTVRALLRHYGRERIRRFFVVAPGRSIRRRPPCGA
jgi:hypothetical protein